MMVRRTLSYNHNKDNQAVQFLYQYSPSKIVLIGERFAKTRLSIHFLSEPCETLTSPDGFTLTSRGQRVLVCLGVGGVATYLAPEILASIKSLGPAVGCGTNTGGEPSPLGQGNALDTMLGGLFRK